MDSKKIAQQLRLYRARNNISQQELADTFGVSRLTVINWESGKKVPSGERMLKIIKMLGGELK